MKNCICILVLWSWTFCLATCSSSDGIGDEEPAPTQMEKFTKRYITDQTFYSNTLKQEIKYNVLLPEEHLINENEHYDVVYLFHGFGDDQSAWSLNLNIQQISDEQKRLGNVRPLIFVMPQGFNSYYCNYYDGSFNYMDMFVNEFVPLIDKRFRTNASSNTRAVAGYSMGGFGALTMAMQHPELFAVSLGLSPSLNTDQQYSTLSQDGFDIQWGTIFGSKGVFGSGRINSYYKSQCPLHIVESKLEPLHKVHFFIDCGDDEERLYAGNGALHNLMRDNNVPHEYRVRNGSHTSSYWRQSMTEGLCFIEKAFQGVSYPEESLHTFGTPQNSEKHTLHLNDLDVDIYTYKNHNVNEDYSVIYYSKGRGKANMTTDKVAMALDSLLGISNIVITGFDAEAVKEKNISLSNIVEYVERNINATKSPKYRIGLAYGTNADFLCSSTSGIDPIIDYLFFEDADVADIANENTGRYFIDTTDGGTNYQSAYNLFCKLRETSSDVEYRIRNGKDTYQSAQTGIYSMIPFMVQLTNTK